ncbi:WecB/TagA/CpsF family glycosyltransferase [Candidatus Caldatribacterium saccharofermentans]|uniref:WecB/TagA/CpsF family glycosyltransferase n=1 Tax=Candidatus Caldatribacterium saccharofermentans TaxID=1454753 RepID=UPI003D070275
MRSVPAVELLGYSFFAGGLEDLRNVVENAVEQGRKLHIVTVNPEMLVFRDPHFLKVLASAELRLPDGIGVVWASRLLRCGMLQRLPGIEVAEAIMTWGSERGWGVYFLGAREDVVQQAAQVMQRRYPGLKVCGCHHGYFTNDAEVVEDIKRTAPEVLFVGMGVPKQELWIARHREALPVKVFMGVGGSFDVWAGKLPRAPLLFRSLGLEWLWRLLLEPRRVQRVVPAFFRFGLRLLGEKWRGWYNTG